MAPGSWDDLIGKPYELGGVGPESYDCFGLALEVLTRLEFPLDFDIASQWMRKYTPGDVDPSILSQYECHVEDAPRKPGDLLIMRNPHSENPRATHVAVHIGKNIIIQSTRAIGVHVLPFQKVSEETVEVITWIK